MIASIGHLPDTLQDRSVVITLRRKLETEFVTRFTPAHHTNLDEIARQAARWTHDNVDALKQADPHMPEGLHDRLKDCWRPLLAIADHVGGRWPEAARKAAVELSGSAGDADVQSAGTMLLMHIRDVLGDAKSIGSTALVSRLTARDDWPWCEWRQGRPITARGVARLLVHYGIRPTHTREGSRYAAASFVDAWRRYTPAANPGGACPTSVTDDKIASNSNDLRRDRPHFSTATVGNVVTDPKTVNSMVFRDLQVVTLAIEGAGDGEVEGML